MRQVWWNGKIIPETEARISIYDSAFMFADTIFEMTRSFNGIHFKLWEHLERLFKSAKYVRLQIPYSINTLFNTCEQITIKNKSNFAEDDEYRLMIDVTRGLLPRYSEVGLEKGVNVIISVFPLKWATQGLGKYFNTGIDLRIPSQRQIPAQLLDPKIKHRSRLHFRMALNEFDWPILLDPDGFISEGPGYNFFIFKDGLITTPEPRNILRGISRDFIYELYDFVEDNIEPYDVLEADEAFITGTPFCMLPVTSLNGQPIGDGKPGKMFNDLLAKWSKEVGVDIRKQILEWDDERTLLYSLGTFKQMQQVMLDVWEKKN